MSSGAFTIGRAPPSDSGKKVSMAARGPRGCGCASCATRGSRTPFSERVRRPKPASMYTATSIMLSL
eukprot:9179882-Pyramimonas_sp.AAC.1